MISYKAMSAVWAAALFALVAVIPSPCDGFGYTMSSGSSSFTSTTHRLSSPIQTSASSTSLNMFFGPKKDDGSPGDYVCKVRTALDAWRQQLHNSDAVAGLFVIFHYNTWSNLTLRRFTTFRTAVTFLRKGQRLGQSSTTNTNAHRAVLQNSASIRCRRDRLVGR
jgi:hypothetical protein